MEEIAACSRQREHGARSRQNSTQLVGKSASRQTRQEAACFEVIARVDVADVGFEFFQSVVDAARILE